jgi:hypothetical protein
MTLKGAVGRRPASGGAECSSRRNKRGAGIAFSAHAEALAEERAVGKSATVDIGAGGRASRAVASSSIGCMGNGEGGGGSSVWVKGGAVRL